MSNALGKLAASVVLDTTDWAIGTKEAQRLAAQTATTVTDVFTGMEKAVKSSMGNMATSLAAGFGVTLSAAGIVGFAKSALDAADALGLAAVKAGMAVETFSALAYAAKQSSVPVDALEAGTKKLNVAIADAVGGGTKYTEAFKAVGVTIDSSSNSAAGFEKVLMQVADTFAKSEDGPTKVAAAVKLFGKAGEDMIPLLNQGSGAIRDLMQKAQDLGLVMDGPTAEAAHKFQQDLDTLTARSSSFARMLVSDVVPGISAVVKAMIDVKTLGLADMAVTGVMESFKQIRGDADGLAGSLQEVNRQIALAQSASERLKDNSWMNFGGMGQYVQQAAQLNSLLEQRAQIEHNIFNAEIADQNARIIAWQQRGGTMANPGGGKGKIPGIGTGKSGADVYAAENAQLDKEIANLNGVGQLQAYIEKLEDSRYSKLSQRQKDDLIQKDAIIVRLKQDAETRKEQVAADDAYFKEMDKITTQLQTYTQALRDQVAQEDFDIANIGKSATEIQKLTALRAIDLDMMKQVAALGDDANPEAVNKIIDQAQAQKQVIATLLDTKTALTEQLQLWTDLSAKAGQFFGDLVMNGKSAFDNLRNMVKQLVQDLIALFAQRFILQIGAGLTGSAVLGNAAASTGAGTASGTILSGLTSGISGTGIFGSSFFGAGSMLGDFSAGLSGAGAGVFASGSAGGIGASIAGVIGAIPVWGQIAAAVGLVAAAISAFSSKPGGPKDGGSFFGSFSSSGAFMGNANVPGSDNGRFYTPSGQDASLATIGQSTASSYYTIAKALGINPQALNFGLGYDTDPNGTAQNRVSSLVTDASGKVVYQDTNRNIGRDSSQIQPEMTLEASRAVLAAIQSSDLPDYLKKVFDGLTPSTATQDQITAAEQEGAALESIFGVLSKNPMQDVATAIAASSNTFQTALTNNATAIKTVIGAYDGSATATQNLATATATYYNAQIQLLAGITQVKQSIDAMFGTTFQNIKLAGMDTQGKYDFYQSDAASAEKQALASDDPATIQALSQRINSDIQAAFNLLTPDQQKAQGAAFVSQGQTVQQAIDDRLDQIQKDAADATTKVLAQIKTILDANSDANTKAADKQVNAANTNLQAANTPVNVNVNLNLTGGVPVVNGGS